ncbi:hypothetical protein NMB32_10540 [Stenotrophomonas sp. CD2]|nr:hypothetical protein NMB32_10540 [Stenotrophomonas sp. CD2]
MVVEVFAAVRVVAFPNGYERRNAAGPRCVPGQCALQMARFQFLRFVDGVRHASCILSGVVAPIENAATTVDDAGSASDRRSQLQWISGMQAPCAWVPRGAVD